MRQCQHELLYGRQGCPPPQTVACTSNFQSGEPISKPLKPTCKGSFSLRFEPPYIGCYGVLKKTSLESKPGLDGVSATRSRSGLACRSIRAEVVGLAGFVRRQMRFHGADASFDFTFVRLALGGSQSLSGLGQALFLLAGLEKQNGPIHRDVRGVRGRQLRRPIQRGSGQRHIALLNERGGGNLKRQIAQGRSVVGPEG